MTNQSTETIAPSLQEVEAYIGRESSYEGADEVSRNDFRRKLEVYCFYCPIYYDEAAAKAHGYRTVVAPNTMTSLWSMPPYWRPGEPVFFCPPGLKEKSGGVHVKVPTPYSHAVNAKAFWEFFDPIYPGDRFKAVGKLVAVTPKRTRLGDGAFLTREVSIWKTTGELVAKRTSSNFCYNKSSDPKKVVQPTPPVDHELLARAMPESNDQVDWSRQRRFEDVVIGDQVPPHRIWLTYQRIVMSVAADRMFYSVHHNREYARSAGLTDIIFNTKGYEFLTEITLRKWIGLEGRLRRLGPFEMKQNTYPGDTVTCSARVVGTELRDDRGLVSLEYTHETPRAGVMAHGEAVIELPRRGEPGS